MFAKFLCYFCIVTKFALRLLKNPIKNSFVNCIFWKEIIGPTIKLCDEICKNILTVLSENPLPKLLINGVRFLETKVFNLFVKILCDNVVKFWLYCTFIVINFKRNLMIISLNIQNFRVTIFWLTKLLIFPMALWIQLRMWIIRYWRQNNGGSHFLLRLSFFVLVLLFLLKVPQNWRYLKFAVILLKLLPKIWILLASGKLVTNLLVFVLKMKLFWNN